VIRRASTYLLRTEAESDEATGTQWRWYRRRATSPRTSKPYSHSTPAISGTEWSVSFPLRARTFSEKSQISIAKRLALVTGVAGNVSPYHCLPTRSTLLCMLATSFYSAFSYFSYITCSVAEKMEGENFKVRILFCFLG
jgi:hypothetical protein